MTSPAVVELTFGNGALAAPVLERLVSAAATRAELSVDRIVNALAALDALDRASDQVYSDDAERRFSIAISPGEVRLSIDGLRDEQTTGLIDAANLPGIDGLLERMAASVTTEQNGEHSSLVLAFT